jgi:membrane fusion protein (multidrug efflux system)
MRKRMMIAILAMATFIVAIGFVKFRQVQAAIAQASSFQPPPVAVTTLVAARESWPAALSAIGTVEAVNGVIVSADLPGIVERITFESGEWVRAGAVLVELDTRQERAQLAAAEARLELARLSLERIAGLLAKGVTSQAEFDAATAEFNQAQAIATEFQAVIERKTIDAPFAGVLGIRRVNVGQYLTAGDAVVPLQSLDPIHVNFTLPQQDLSQVRAGGEVKVAADGTPGAPGAEYKGTITALDSIVDAATRNVRLQATLANPGGALRPGMFVGVRAVLETSAPVVALPASAISYAPYGDSVFVVDELEGPGGSKYLGVRQKFVKLGGARGDQIAVVSGVAPGDEIVTSGVFRLRNGAAVQVNNDIQPANDPAPAPEDN